MKLLHIAGVAAAVIATLPLAAPALAAPVAASSATDPGPNGTVRVTLSDSLTGKPVPRPCVTIRSLPDGVQACGRDGLVVLDDVPPGEWNILLSGGASYFSSPDRPTVSVQAGETTSFVSTLEPGAAIRTKAVDAATGAPLAYICANLVATSWDGQNGAGGTCSDADGTIEIGPFDFSGTFHLFAQQLIGHSNPAPAVRYGAQWVGPRGGTGDQRKARTVTLTEHVTTTVPAIRMDRTGAITGTITSAATGRPVAGVCAFSYARVPDRVGGNPNCSDSEGHYTIDDLGPYAWPVEFVPSLDTGLAWQWSGGAADRLDATYTPVRVGQTATVDAALAPGGTLAGTVTDDGAPVKDVRVATFNRRTHDYAGSTYDNPDTPGSFTLSGLRTQELWVRFSSFSSGKECWMPVTVTDGQTTQVAIDLGTDCGAQPVG